MSTLDPIAPHVPDGSLRARADGAVSDAVAAAAIDAHVAACPACAARAADLAAIARTVGGALAALDPTTAEAAPDAGLAFARWSTRRPADSPSTLERLARKVNAMTTVPSLSPRARRLAVGTSLALVVAGAFGLQPVRALASQFLQLFRVQRVQVLQLDPGQIDTLTDGGMGEAVGQLLAESVTVDRDPGSPRTVADAAAASDAAGFAVRLPESGPSPSEIEVHEGPAFSFVVDRAHAQSVMDAAAELTRDAGNTDAVDAPPALPEAIDGARVAVDVPNGVVASFGDCPSRQQRMESRSVPADGAGEGDGSTDGGAHGDVQVFGQPVGGSDADGSADSDSADEAESAHLAGAAGRDCVVLTQMPSPTVSAPPGLDIAAMAELGLRFTGMSAADARTYSHTIDWSSTLVVPVPRGSVDASEIAVDGVTGVLLLQHLDDYHLPGYTILWAKDGRVYALTGSGTDAAAGLRLAEALP